MPMLHSFTKMHGLGNDFVVFDDRSGHLQLTADRARRIADRRFGIGCDQILVFAEPESPSADLRMQIWNHDGSEVEHCGNGARCVARLVHDRGIVKERRVTLGLAKGEVTARLNASGTVTIDMGMPDFRPDAVPISAPVEALA